MLFINILQRLFLLIEIFQTLTSLGFSSAGFCPVGVAVSVMFFTRTWAEISIDNRGLFYIYLNLNRNKSSFPQFEEEHK
jgi:hypothetical protein